MMQVVVYINGREIAQATAMNVSNLADVSDYLCEGDESPSQITPGFSSRDFRIDGHNRKQTCWALVAKMATHLTSALRGGSQ